MTDWSSTVELAGCDPNWKDNISSLLDDIEWSIEIRPIVEKIRNGQRLDLTDGILLYNHTDLFEIGLLHFLYYSSNI